jgi:hypothetical protein
MFQKAITKYRNDGLIALISKGGPYLKHRAEFSVKSWFLDRRSIHRDELKRYAEKRGRIWYYGEETTFDIEPPLTAETPAEFQPLLGPHTCPPSFVLDVPNAKLTGPYGIAQTKDGRIIFEEIGRMTTLSSILSATSATLGTRRTARKLFLRRQRCESVPT